jgi:superfamily II DNA or RNA helicase
MKLIDNINELFGEDLKESIKVGSKFQIAASCFSIYAYEALKKELDKVDSLEFIFTSPTFTPSEVTDKIRKERREFYIPKLNRERSLYGTEFEIALKNKLTQRAIARECSDWLRKKATFKSNKSKTSMQQFANIDTKGSTTTYMPICGFTAVDLGYQSGDSASNIINKFDETSHTKVFLDLFNEIWNDSEKLEDVTESICNHIESVYQENSPEKIYFFMLYNIFNEFLEEINEDVLPNDLNGYKDTVIWNKLYNFQKDAATGVINKLETYNGCILADSVGLGKTFTALAVIKYYELRNKSVLVLCPKKLSENWLNFNRNLVTNILSKDRLNYDVLAHTDLQRNSGESMGMPLNKVNWSNYDLVVIDESHNFRNNDAYNDRETRYQKLMNKVIKQGVKTKVLMLSATPVNNRFSDLKNQLALAYEGDSSSLKSKIKTHRDIETIFSRAQAVFNAWSKLPAERRTAKTILESLDFDFFQLLDSVTIARSRKHIETFYDMSDLGKFPARLKPLSFHCPLTDDENIMDFNEIYKELILMKLSVYAPVAYILPSKIKKYEEMYDTDIGEGRTKFKQLDREKSLVALMTTNLLKRLESSVHSFRLTLDKLRQNNLIVLKKIEEFKATGKDTDFEDRSKDFENLEADDDDLLDDNSGSIGNKVKIKLSDMDIIAWEEDLKTDMLHIESLLKEMHLITPEKDNKLQHLIHHINNKINNPINKDNKKILLFTAFADTADYLYENIAPKILQTHGLHTAVVTGSDAPRSNLGKDEHKKFYDFQSLLTLFSPRSKEKEAVLPNEPKELDILIGTDCISEGQNLQDCDYLINYDIHWNPVRIIQRFGRIDRIGSINDVIQLVNYWPDISLDEYINLKERVESRMVIADVTATGDDNVLNAKANDVSYRKEQLRKLQEEVIEMEDVKAGVSITDLGLNDFRMDLINYIKENGELDNLPSGMHAVVTANPQRGLEPGTIFTLRNINPDININLQNRLHPFYLIYISNKGEVIHDHTEVKRLLDLARAACKGESTPIPDVCNLFNKLTKDGRDMAHSSELLNQAIRSMIEVKEEKDIDSLFRTGKTTALTNKIDGLDDFELVSFIVIQDLKEAW